MIDLHTHTIYSDGSSTLKELLIEANKKNIEVLSITDHDNVKAYTEIKNNNLEELFNGKLISGVELNANFDGVKIELLGYDFNIEEMNKWCTKVYEEESKVDLDREFDLLIEACHKNNIKIDDLSYSDKSKWPIDIVLESVKKYEKENKEKFPIEAWNDDNYLFRCMTCDKTFPLYVDFSYQMPSAKEVSDEIRKNKGKVFLAHLFVYPLKDYVSFLDKLREEKIIDGLEVYHSSFTKEESDFLIQYCRKYNLLMSGGSDYHGKKKKNRNLGTGYNNLNISKDILNDWKI